MAKQDNDMLLRVAQEAAYHNILLYKLYPYFKDRIYTTIKNEITFDSAFNKLIIEIQNELMVESKALPMAVLLEKYQSYQSKIDHSYSAQNLQNNADETSE